MAKLQNYWTKEKCIEAARTVSKRSELKKKFPQAYRKISQFGIQKEAYSHMKVVESTQFHLIYLIKFSTDAVYIGQTRKSIGERLKFHTNTNCAVSRYIKQHNCTFELYLLTDKNIGSNSVADVEDKYIEEYRSKGFVILNSTKGGSLGADSRRWNFEKIHKEALKYNRRKDFELGSKNAYHSAIRRKIIEQVCSHMQPSSSKKIWFEENIRTEALKYKSRGAFNKGSRSAYVRALNTGIIDSVCSHMKNFNRWNRDINTLIQL